MSKKGKPTELGNRAQAKLRDLKVGEATLAMKKNYHIEGNGQIIRNHPKKKLSKAEQKRKTKEKFKLRGISPFKSFPGKDLKN